VNVRTSYRVLYPANARPWLVMNATPAQAAPVVECSEGGLSYEVPLAWPTVELGAPVSGCVEFQRAPGERGPADDAPAAARPSVPVTGEVVRVLGRIVAVRLESPGIPFGVLLREQLALRFRYPGWPEQQDTDTEPVYWQPTIER
jgi:hypothetical protein